MAIKTHKKKLSCLLAVMLAAFVLLLGGCNATDEAKSDDIVVLYTNDVHCAIDDDIGYAGLVAYRKWCEKNTPYVTLVDCGDALQGDVIGTVSGGEYPAEIMKRAGYDFAVLGNHEFDYGMEQVERLMEISGVQYLGCNIRYTGEGDAAFLSRLLPYEIVSYGDVEVAFIGVSTPESIVKSVPAYFRDENGNYVYDFFGGSGEELYGCVQQNVDACLKDGADYVLVLAHLGTDESSSPFTSSELIANTRGIDAVLDGHSHSEISCDIIKNADGENVLLSSTGTGLCNIGHLTITANGNIRTGLIETYSDTDGEISEYIESLEEGFEADLAKKVGVSEVTLTTSDSGIRLVRNRETNLGDFCADAYRAVSGADIALVNGGGIRADIAAGEVTYGDILSVHPYGNSLCTVKATGQEILDALEMASRFCLSSPDDGENAVGENGGFLQVSGLKYTIDTSVKSTVETDEQGNFLSCGDGRRVKNVFVLGKDGSFTELAPDRVYTVASHNYLIKEGGDGLNMFTDNEPIIDEGMKDYEILITYLRDVLDGTVGNEYALPQGRIEII